MAYARAMKILLVLAGLALASCAKQPSLNQAGTAWITQSLKIMQTIKSGMTRADLLKVFTTEAGVSNRFHRTYVFRECPYMKVRVDFDAIRNPGDVLGEQPDDRIKAISTPYQEWIVFD